MPYVKENTNELIQSEFDQNLINYLKNNGFIRPNKIEQEFRSKRTDIFL